MATTLLTLRTKYILMWAQGIVLILLVMVSTINLNGFRYELPTNLWDWTYSLSPFVIAFIILFGVISLSKVPTKEEKGITKVVARETQPIEYRSELIEIPPRFKDHIINGKMTELNKFFIKRAEEGWELAAYTYVAPDGDGSPAMMITYKKISK